MMMQKPSRFSFVFLATILTFCFFQQPSYSFQHPQAPAPSPASMSAAPKVIPSEKLSLQGLPNSGKVTERIYRGGQPKTDGYPQLKNLGINIVVDFHNTGAGMEHEKQIVEGMGMKYVSLPASVISGPTDEQIAQFLKIVVTNPDDKIFVHCNLGSDRTGVAIAAYRITQQQWNIDQAFTEMHQFHFHTFLFSMSRYVKNFPVNFAQNPAFFDLRKPLPPPPLN